MTSEKWKKVRAVFTKAADIQDPVKIAAYLNRACHGQAWLREEVESLLRQEKKPGRFLKAPSSFSAGKMISHYRVIEVLGGGGMGVVYKVHDTRLDREVVLKSLPPWMMTDREAKARLIQEAKRAAALNHLHVVTVHDIAEQDNAAYIVMEYVVGQTLDHLIPRKGLSVRQALRYALPIADALAAIHTAGILHGDVKPSNIMVTARGHVKVLDFGLASAFAAERRQVRDARSLGFGTKAYMAPEQLRNPSDDPDLRSEIFSFGLLLHQMLSGRHPFQADTLESLTQAILSKAPNPLPRKVPASVAATVERCLERDPMNRFRSMQDVVSSLQNVPLLASTAGAGATPKRQEKHSPAVERSKSNGMRRVREIAKRIGHDNVARSRRALSELARLVGKDPSPATRESTVSALKDFILTLGDYEGPVPMPVRELRQQVMGLIKSATQGNFTRCFGAHDLEFLDLYGMNFDAGELTGLSFKGCFPVEASFQGSRLVGACFARASLRNVNFANADLSDADFTDADWFNALALTERQLKSLRRDTLIDCPETVTAMHEYLEAHYVLPFSAWSGRVQQQLLATWKEYLRPKGLGELVSSWRRKSR